MAIAATAGTRVHAHSQFYLGMSLLIAATAFIGFAPTFWLPMSRGDYVPSPLTTIHGLLFFFFIVFYVWQNWLVVSGNTARHRAAGLFGIALVSVMTVSGFIVLVLRIKHAADIGKLDAGLSFAILPFWHIVFFAGFVAAAIANISRPDWHKRLMLMAVLSTLDAPIARLFIYFGVFHGHMPVAAGLPPTPPHLTGLMPWEYVLLGYFLIPIAYDWRMRGRPHPAYLIGGGLVPLLMLLEAPLGPTSAWHGVAGWLLALAR
jgi:hypothetical protein